MPLEAIAAEGLFFRYNGTEVLSDLTFGVEVGDYVGLVGPNGSGKTTLIKIILGLARPAAGSVSLFGREPSHFKEWHRVGYLPQRLAFFNPFFPATVREIVGLGLLSKKSFPKRITGSDEGAIEGTLNLMDIMHLRDRLIGELSGGQQQRVLLARALVNEPDILILDEPTAALDPETRERFYAVLTELNKSRRATIILITHDIGSVGKYTSKLLYLDKSIIFYGGFEDFCHSEEMGRYFGEYSQHLICHRHE